MKQRDYGIDILKVIAVLLIINSHADDMYPHMKVLATGGAIGDCLFLFCSGFTLLMGGGNSFDNFYKRRINRIYPTVFAAVAFKHIWWGTADIHYGELLCLGTFVSAIMVYYVLIYFIKKYLMEWLNLTLSLVGIISLVVYIWWFPYKYETGSEGLYGITTGFRWIPYFGAMLLGAIVGMKREKMAYHARWDFLMFMSFLALFYGIQMAAKMYRPFAPLQIVSLLPLMALLVYLYKWCRSQCFKKIYDTKLGNLIIMVVGGLCLESYLIQFTFFTDKMNHIWPLNILIIIIVILFFSYIVRCGARVFSQTFRTEDYEWKKVFSLY